MGTVETINDTRLICRKLLKGICQSSSADGEMMVKWVYEVTMVELSQSVDEDLHMKFENVPSNNLMSVLVSSTYREVLMTCK